ncbi:hypothetical protein EDE08_108264 [Bradyrhizobium sp. R2.2-H]|nr:hypothetical protein EDE10_108264 [Bradyrhizobium sp. Y-H1]TCU71008.1 hypothetical protein EDE08_108264 [Bradyrhizobium sp. R2.2-H]
MHSSDGAERLEDFRSCRRRGCGVGQNRGIIASSAAVRVSQHGRLRVLLRLFLHARSPSSPGGHGESRLASCSRHCGARAKSRSQFCSMPLRASNRRGYCSTNFDDLTLHRKHTAQLSQCAAMICTDRSPAATYRNNHDPLSMMLGNLPSGAQQQDNKGCAPCANASGLRRFHGNRTAIRADIRIALRPSEASDLRSFACCQ